MRRAAAALFCLLLTQAVYAQSAPLAVAATPWWVWPIALFLACFVMGIIAVPAGIGGGTLVVPIVGSYFPFHRDFGRRPVQECRTDGECRRAPGEFLDHYRPGRRDD